jgi:hypothetical protein
MARSRLVDLQVLDDEAAFVAQALGTAADLCSEHGSPFIDIMGLGERTRALVDASGYSLHRVEHAPHFLYRARESALAQGLATADAWEPTLYDGDGCLWRA